MLLTHAVFLDSNNKNRVNEPATLLRHELNKLNIFLLSGMTSAQNDWMTSHVYFDCSRLAHSFCGADRSTNPEPPQHPASHWRRLPCVTLHVTSQDASWDYKGWNGERVSNNQVFTKSHQSNFWLENKSTRNKNIRLFCWNFGTLFYLIVQYFFKADLLFGVCE